MQNNSNDNNNIKNSLSTAILFLVFNRMSTTKQVFEAIRAARPERLYISADGYRNSIPDEKIKVEAVRKFIINNIDWDCDVKTLFRENNLGCKNAVSSGIDWFFQNEEMGIILEDDCLPHPSFFTFCEELLQKYKNDMRVWHISGVSTLNESVIFNQDSYYFSRFNHIWGWASWASRWRHYDVKMSQLNEFSKGGYIENITNSKFLQEFWLNNFITVANGEIDTWDYQWYFTTWVNGGVSIIPSVNLISNIGFGVGATHPTSEYHKLSKMKTYEMTSQLIHPKILIPNRIYDEYNAKVLFNLNVFRYLVQMIKKTTKYLLRRYKW